MARKRNSAPFNIRLSEDIDRLITAEARRTKRSKGAVIEALVMEALKTRLVPGIAFRDDDDNRRAWVIGTALDVWQIIEAFKDFDEDRERMLADADLSEPHLRTALAYYERFPDEIDEFIAANRRPLDELLRDYPHADVIYVDVD